MTFVRPLREVLSFNEMIDCGRKIPERSLFPLGRSFARQPIWQMQDVLCSENVVDLQLLRNIVKEAGAFAGVKKRISFSPNPSWLL